MKETIYTIPINEAFDRYEGCPVCRLWSKLDADSVEYVMGAAMMEPDVRVRTNQLGFCGAHLEKMLAVKNRLSLALILESRLPELEAALFPQTKRSAPGGERDVKKLLAASQKAKDGCFVCERVGGFMAHYYENIL
ncbi:MAG: DUF6062 family protein, partial [Clostridiales bacterium]|nr:DUF6062 family protein [Clostridiales bacterium]